MSNALIEKIKVWLATLALALFALAVIGGLAYSHVTSKLEICRTYYPEISTYSCYMSNLGLPPKTKSRD